MTGIKTLGSGETINTPAIKQMLVEDLVNDLGAEYEAKMKTNFTEKTGYPCGVCKASGYDIDEKMPCLACEGTGTDYEIIYGVEDGELFAYTKQYGMDHFKEYCKAMREAEADATLRQRADRPITHIYALPAVIDMELQARGFSPEDIRGSGPRRSEVTKVVQRDYPYLMTTNYRL